MFTQTFYIRESKANDSVINFLHSIGYKKTCSGTKFAKKDYIFCMNGKYSYESLHFIQSHKYAVYCHNEMFFKSLATLNDENEYMQYFKLNNGEICLCECMSMTDMWGDFEESEQYPIKLTPQELKIMFDNLRICL